MRSVWFKFNQINRVLVLVHKLRVWVRKFSGKACTYIELRHTGVPA